VSDHASHFDAVTVVDDVLGDAALLDALAGGAPPLPPLGFGDLAVAADFGDDDDEAASAAASSAFAMVACFKLGRSFGYGEKYQHGISCGPNWTL
jgi:hypothetical protein